MSGHVLRRARARARPQLSLGRAALRASYERAVRVNMARELHALAAGFSRDLIGPDDFSRGAGAARTRPTSP